MPKEDEALRTKLKNFALKKGEKYSKSGLEDAIELGQLMVDHTATPFDNIAFETLKSFQSKAVEFLDQIYDEDEASV